jgi:hypothetical protein
LRDALNDARARIEELETQLAALKGNHALALDDYLEVIPDPMFPMPGLSASPA